MPAVSSKTKKFHNVKVSNLPCATTTKQVFEHFQSRKFIIYEVAAHTRNSKESIACVHFKREENQRSAIRKINGSPLHGRKLTVEPCFCTRTLREKKRCASSVLIFIIPSSKYLLKVLGRKERCGYFWIQHVLLEKIQS